MSWRNPGLVKFTFVVFDLLLVELLPFAKISFSEHFSPVFCDIDLKFGTWIWNSLKDACATFVYWVSRHLERVYEKGSVNKAKNKDMGREMLILIITAVVVGLVKTKTTEWGVKSRIAYISLEKDWDIWIIQKYMHVPVFGERREIPDSGKKGMGMMQLGWTIYNRREGGGYVFFCGYTNIVTWLENNIEYPVLKKMLFRVLAML